jgi:hypothetical protein
MAKKTIHKLIVRQNDSIFKDKTIYELFIGGKNERYK